jgi:hypothetical protein
MQQAPALYKIEHGLYQNVGQPSVAASSKPPAAGDRKPAACSQKPELDIFHFQFCAYVNTVFDRPGNRAKIGVESMDFLSGLLLLRF